MQDHKWFFMSLTTIECVVDSSSSSLSLANPLSPPSSSNLRMSKLGVPIDSRRCLCPFYRTLYLHAGFSVIRDLVPSERGRVLRARPRPRQPTPLAASTEAFLFIGVRDLNCVCHQTPAKPGRGIRLPTLLPALSRQYVNWSHRSFMATWTTLYRGPHRCTYRRRPSTGSR